MTLRKTRLASDLEAALQALEGAVIPRMAVVPLAHAEGLVSLEFSKLWEAQVAKCLQDLRPGALRVLAEPNGPRSCPDLRLVTANGYAFDVEAKSARAEKQAAYDIAGLDIFYETLRKGDGKYFRMHYAVARYAEDEASFAIAKASVMKIWEITTGEAKGGGRRALRPRAGGTTPLLFLHHALRQDPTMLATENERLWRGGVEMLEGLRYASAAEIDAFSTAFRGN